MKKVLTIVIVLIICAAMLSGCVAKKEVDIGSESAQPKPSASALVTSAEPSAEPDDTGADEKIFSWNWQNMSILYVLDDGSVVNGSNKPDGRYIQVFIECVDGELAWADIGLYTEFSVRDTQGNEYAAVAAGFKAVEGSSTNIADMEKNKYMQINPIFDIPTELSIDDLELRYLLDMGDNDAHGEISLKGMPTEAPEQK